LLDSLVLVSALQQHDEAFLHPRNKAHLLVVYNPFNMLLNLIIRVTLASACSNFPQASATAGTLHTFQLCLPYPSRFPAHLNK